MSIGIINSYLLAIWLKRLQVRPLGCEFRERILTGKAERQDAMDHQPGLGQAFLFPLCNVTGGLARGAGPPEGCKIDF